MKKLLLLLALVPTLGSASNIGPIKTALTKFQPLTVTDNAGDLQVITEQATVNNTLYRKIVTQGICIPLHKSNILKGIKTITVLNKLKNQGYVFKGGKKECAEMAAINSQVSEIFLMRHSNEIKQPEKAK
ncbi:MAG: hypothetical protein ISEC1_P0491 [Thiomicrorhabdus sp.]|nr:MAG: hypothetical protein ISEC1_P0491 [Thiomicrorhabdus sp.]